ncbi:4'-phosphopantetheinyl transferase superfamily protein [Mycobacterium sp. KBS0706]|uniref:4'-phosphopantetheinyl transferase family protein n=1 Tax=Mycobacterium sp. KBS0706 TaxID=2578109 RepID=UPI00110FBC33|nr:4'-phosphopantetheinyl transferase superfamily protein [Mycobacterium sp. KBS0706]TSD90784.1 4'-phosphopantetheinyl transferase superfamily protein [Mycobacterium sp. KBS0706]
MSDIWAMPSGFPDLPPGQVHVWRLRTERDPAAGLAVLSAEERRRADAFRTDLLRARYVCAHAALRLLLGRTLDLPADRLRFRQNAWGKPELAEGDLRFNLSHSGPWAVVALARGIEVGVDVETVSHPPPMEVAGIAYSTAERAALAGLSGPALTAAFYAVWTRKEALAKGIGRGFSFDFTGFTVSTDPAERTSRPKLPPGPVGEADWHLHDLPPIEGAAAAVAVPADGIGVAPRRFEPGLWGL